MPMMKSVLAILAMLSALCLLSAQTPDWLWAVSAGGTVHEQGRDVAVDADGNIYVTGGMQWESTFGSIVIDGYGYDDVFVAKLDPAGNWLWAVHAGGSSSDGGFGIDLDSAGNVYVCGVFQGTAAFGGHTLTATPNGNNDPDGFVAKLDPAGNWLWAVSIPCTGYIRARGLAVDGTGNCLVTGQFLNNAAFGNETLVSAGSSDVFVAKLDPAGNWLWAQRMGGTEVENGYGIAVDGSGCAWICGNFQGSVTVGAETLTSLGGFDIFAAKLNPDGNWLEAVRAGGPNTSDFIPDKATAIAIDSENNAYITGNFQEYACFGSTCFSSAGPYNADVYVAKLDPAGNWLWAVQATGTSTDSAYGICVDPNGLVSITGCFYETLSFFGPGSLTSLGNIDIFAAQLDSEGNWLRALRAGGIHIDSGHGIAASQSGNIYLTGYFMATTDFGDFSLTSQTGEDIFVACIGSQVVANDDCLPPLAFLSRLDCHPNPFSTSTLISFEVGEERADYELSVYDLRGRKVAIMHQGRLDRGKQEFVWSSPPELPAGIYLCRLSGGGFNLALMLVKLP